VGQHKKTVEACLEKGLVQLVDFPTHLRGNILDIVLTNSQNVVRSIEERGRLGRSDHTMMEIELEVTVKRKAGQEQMRNWKKANWEEIKRGLREQEWPTEEDQCTTEHSWQQLRTVIDKLVEQHVLLSRMRPFDTPWMTSELLLEIRRKRRLWKKAKEGGEAAKTRYEEVERKVKNMVRNAKRGLERGLAREKDRNSKPF